MDDPKNSKNINVATLSSFRITYKEELLSDDAARDLPERVQALRGGLLSWNGRIIKEYIETKEIQNQLKQGDISSEYIPSEYIYTKTDGFLKQEADEMGKRLNPEVDLALHIRHEATRLHKEIAQEKRWEALLLDTVFKQLKYRTAPTSGYWHDFALGQQITLESDHIWNDDHKIAKAEQSATDLTQPKPDIYLGFPIHDLLPEESGGFLRHEFMQNFSIDTLGLLLNKGLACTPTTGVQRYLEKRGKSKVANERSVSGVETIIESGIANEGDFSKEHLLCFPWAVVELKKQFATSKIKSAETPGPIEKCYCQGANAASRALRMFEILSQYSDTANGEQIPPVVVLTFIGPEFKLWIAYSSLDSNGIYHYQMICIEEQSILNFWGALRLHQIVNDMSFWATMILKPKISMYIDQWRLRHMHGFRVDLFKDRLLFDTIQKVEKRQKHIGLHRSSNLAEMVRMALIIQEVSSAYRDSSSQTQELTVPPDPFSTPVFQSGPKAATRSTKSGKTSRNSAADTPSRPGLTKNTSAKNATKPAPDLENIVKPGPPAYQFRGTQDVVTVTSSAYSTTTYNARLPPSSFTTNIFTSPKVSKSEAASISTTTSSVEITDTSDAVGTSFASNNERVTASTAKSRNMLEFLAEPLPDTRRGNLGSSQATTDNPSRLSKDYNVSAGGHIIEDNTDTLSSERESSKGESWGCERLSEVIDDILLFSWPKESS